MAFTEKDRIRSIQTQTDVGWIKETHERRLAALEEEDKVLHHRVNVVRNTFTGISSIMTAAGLVLAAWFNSKGGD